MVCRLCIGCISVVVYKKNEIVINLHSKNKIWSASEAGWSIGVLSECDDV